MHLFPIQPGTLPLTNPKNTKPQLWILSLYYLSVDKIFRQTYLVFAIQVQAETTSIIPYASQSCVQKRSNFTSSISFTYLSSFSNTSETEFSDSIFESIDILNSTPKSILLSKTMCDSSSEINFFKSILMYRNGHSPVTSETVTEILSTPSLFQEISTDNTADEGLSIGPTFGQSIEVQFTVPSCPGVPLLLYFLISRIEEFPTTERLCYGEDCDRSEIALFINAVNTSSKSSVTLFNKLDAWSNAASVCDLIARFIINIPEGLLGNVYDLHAVIRSVERKDPILHQVDIIREYIENYFIKKKNSDGSIEMNNASFCRYMTINYLVHHWRRNLIGQEHKFCCLSDKLAHAIFRKESATCILLHTYGKPIGRGRTISIRFHQTIKTS